MRLLVFISMYCLAVSGVLAQKPYVQVQASGGYSIPILDLSQAHHFSENGWNANLGFAMFFGKIGIMANGGYQRFGSSNLFEDFITEKYFENPRGISGQYWENGYAMIGPVFKWTFGRFDLDIFGQIGMSSLTVPTHQFNRIFLGRTYDVASYYGKNDELLPIWKGGFSLHTRLSKGLFIYFEPSFLSNMSLSKTNTNFRYINALDVNNNGFLEDGEYVEADVIRQNKQIEFSNLNLNVGVSYQIGRQKKSIDPTPMISLEEDLQEQNRVTIPDEKGERTSIQETHEWQDGSITQEGAKNQGTQTPQEVIASSEMKSENNAEVQESLVAKSDVGEIKIDEAEAKFLYRAGEMYFQTNDFENAVACFNKLKNDPNHLMSKYMFALAMSEMMNCDEALKEYELFEKVYDKDDMGVLKTVFLSHHEKCKKSVVENQKALELALAAEKAEKEKMSIENKVGLDVNTHDQQPANLKEVNSKKSSTGKTYKIQFVALKISNKTFPRLENIGDITHEYFPRKSMYRYTLGPYTSEDEAVSDMLKIRVMGFQDAFLAEYKNGTRTNTLYHAQ